MADSKQAYLFAGEKSRGWENLFFKKKIKIVNKANGESLLNKE